MTSVCEEGIMCKTPTSTSILIGFWIGMSAVFLAAACASAIPTQYLDRGWGTLLGSLCIAGLCFGVVLCQRGMYEVRQSAGKVGGRALGLAGQVVPLVLVGGAVVVYCLYTLVFR